MTVVFIAWGDYVGFQDAVAMAEAKAGCDVVVISERRVPCVSWINISEFPSAHLRPGLGLLIGDSGFLAPSICRWLVLHDYLTGLSKVDWPVLCLDWDVLVFRSLVQAYAPFLSFDYTNSVCDGCASAAYGINRMRPIVRFNAMIREMIENNSQELRNLNDMVAWNRNRDTNGLSAGNLYEEHNSSVFDHNVHEVGLRFEPMGGPKEIDWIGGAPYFIEKDTRRRIAANTIHCWGTFKTKTSELRKLAGV